MLKYVFVCSMVGVFALTGEQPLATQVSNINYDRCLQLESVTNTVTEAIKICKS